MTKKARKRTSASLLAGAACLVAGALCFTSLAGSGMASASDVDAGGKYYSAYEDYAELLEAVGEVNLQTAEEGQVLLKNDGTLPLNGNESVSVFGIASSTTVGGPNSGDAYWEYTGNEVSDRGSIYDSLEAAGFRVNPTLADYYAGLGFSNSDIGNETTEFTNQVNNSLKLYDDVGVIVLSRYGGEGSDLALITDEEEDNMYGDEEAGFEHDALYKGEYVASSGGGGGSSSSSYEYAITFTVSGGTDPVEEEDPVYLTKEEVEELINSALGGILTEDDIQDMIDEATSSITSITEADVQALIDAAIAEYDAQSGSETTDENSGCSGSGAGVAMIVMLAAAAAVSGAVIVAKSRENGDK